MAHQDPVERFCAIITAAGQAGEGLAPLLGVSEKCAAIFDGVPLARRAVDAAIGAGAQEVVAVAGEAVRSILKGVCPCASPGANPVESAKNGVGLLQSDAPILFLPGDLPLVQAQHVRSFIDSLPTSKEPWIAAGLVSKDDIDKEFPGIANLGTFRLSRKRYAGGGLFATSRAAFDRLAPLLSEFAEDRKSQFRMARRFGIAGMAKLALGLLSFEDAEAAGERMFGCRTLVQPGFHPATILDVDTPEDWRYAQSLLPPP